MDEEPLIVDFDDAAYYFEFVFELETKDNLLQDGEFICCCYN